MSRRCWRDLDSNCLCKQGRLFTVFHGGGGRKTLSTRQVSENVDDLFSLSVFLWHKLGLCLEHQASLGYVVQDKLVNLHSKSLKTQNSPNISPNNQGATAPPFPNDVPGKETEGHWGITVNVPLTRWLASFSWRVTSIFSPSIFLIMFLRLFEVVRIASFSYVSSAMVRFKEMISFLRQSFCSSAAEKFRKHTEEYRTAQGYSYTP